MLHFPKVILLRQIRSKGLISYCKNAAYYDITPSLSIKEGKKMHNTHISKKKITYKQFKTRLSLPTGYPFAKQSGI